MKNQRIQITNETFQELGNLKEFTRRLPISSQAKIQCGAFLDASTTRLQEQPLELDMVKLQLIVKLQQEILKEIGTNSASAQKMIETEIALLGMFEDLEHKLSLNQHIVNLKVVITLMDFKIHLRFGFEPKLSMEELLPHFDELHLWERYIDSTHTHVKYFYLCLIHEYLAIQDIVNTLQVLLELIDYLLKHISNDQAAPSHKNIQNKPELRLMLLKLHLIYKTLKKMYSSNIQLKNQHKIYSALYELDHSIIEQYTFNFKKQQSKGTTETSLFVKSKIVQMILDYNEGTIQRECSLIRQPKKITLNVKKSVSAQAVNRRPSVSFKLKERAFSLKKIHSNQIKIENKMFIPKTVSTNVMLERRLKLKQEMVGLSSKKRVLRLDKVASIKQIQQEGKNWLNEAEEKDPLRNKSDSSRQHAISYESCKKNSLNKNYELDMMICPRLNDVNLRLCTSNNTNRDSSLFKTQAYRKRRVIGKKGSLHFSQNRSNSQKADLNEPATQQITLPPSIRRVLQQYLHGFRCYIFYQTQRLNFPLYRYISQLHLNIPYFFQGVILTIKKIEIEYLTFTVTFCLDASDYRVVRVDLIESDIQRIKSLFRERLKTKYQLLSFHFLGKVISLYTLHIILPSINKKEKFQVRQIKDQRQIYTHAAIVTSQDYHKHHVKKILSAQAQYINSINRSLQITYNYDSCRSNHKATTKVIEARPQKFWQFLRADSTLKPILVQTDRIKVALKVGQHIALITIRMVRNIQSFKLFAVVEYDRIKYFKKYGVLAIEQMPLGKVVQVVDSFNSGAVSDAIIQRQWSDVQLSQPMFRLPSKKYVASLLHQGYQIYQSYKLIENQLLMVTGQIDNIKWLILVILKDFQPSILPCLRRQSKRDAKQLTTKKQLSLSHTSRSFPPLKQDMYQLWRKQQIRSISLHGSAAFLDRRQYKLFYFQFCWTIFLRQMFYHCFYHNNQVLVFKVTQSKLLYICKYMISPERNQKSIVYAHFRRKLIAELMSRKIVVVEWNMVVLVKVEGNSIRCRVDDSQDHVEIAVDSKELIGFKADTGMIDGSFLERKGFLGRLKKVFKMRYQDLEHRQI